MKNVGLGLYFSKNVHYNEEHIFVKRGGHIEEKNIPPVGYSFDVSWGVFLL